MNLIIQHNWTTGLGDLFCASTEYLNFISDLKKQGYETKLIFSFNGEYNLNKYIGLNPLENIYDLNSFKLFDEIEVRDRPITDLTINALKYHHTQYGATKPGQHWWDVYFDIVPSNVVYPNYNPNTLLYKNTKPTIFPRFNEEVYKRADSFSKTLGKDYNFLQIRYYDYREEVDESLLISLEILYSKIQNSGQVFHLGSNNKFVCDKFSNLENVREYKFKNLDLFSNDHSYYFYNKHLSNELLLDRLYDNLAEMVSVSNSKKIYLYSTFSWISNFLFYGMSQSTEQFKFELLDKNLEGIDF